MKIKLAFSHFEKDANKVFCGEELVCSDLHSGSTFDAEISLTKEQEDDLKIAFSKDFNPMFWAIYSYSEN